MILMIMMMSMLLWFLLPWSSTEWRKFCMCVCVKLFVHKFWQWLEQKNRTRFSQINLEYIYARWKLQSQHVCICVSPKKKWFAYNMFLCVFHLLVQSVFSSHTTSISNKHIIIIHCILSVSGYASIHTDLLPCPLWNTRNEHKCKHIQLRYNTQTHISIHAVIRQKMEHNLEIEFVTANP